MKRNLKQIRKQGGLFGVFVLLVWVISACGSAGAPGTISNAVLTNVETNPALVEGNPGGQDVQVNPAAEVPAGEGVDVQAGAPGLTTQPGEENGMQPAQEEAGALQTASDPSQTLVEQAVVSPGEPALVEDGPAGQAPAGEQAEAPAVALAAPAQKVAADPAVLNLETKAEVGFMAPDFSLQTLDGQTVRLADLRGKPVMVNYWATWCNPCKAELPILEKLQAEFAAQGLVILTINAIEQDNLGDLQALVGQMGLKLPILLDGQNQFQSMYKQLFFPTSYYIDAYGVIRYIKLGDAPEAEIRTKLEMLVNNQL